jgi:hypothetical protein
MAFADDLAQAIRLAGTPCTRLREGDPDEADGPIVLADGPKSRDHLPQPTRAITIFLRTPGRAAGPGDAQSRPGDREHGSDIVIDYHDPMWPVIRRGSSTWPTSCT